MKSVVCACFAVSAAFAASAARPPEAERTFRSAAVDAKIAEVAAKIEDDAVRSMFESCYPNTLDTTVKGSGYVITGDIDAMWLRDSAAQVWPYLRHLREDTRLKALVRSLVLRQFAAIRRDPYANAFYADERHVGEWKDDMTDMKPGLHERKYEIDSLCYPVRLAHGYWRATGDASIFDGKWERTVRTILATFREQQRKNGPMTSYCFQRMTKTPVDTLGNGGYGHPVKPVGLIASAFRPSDDATVLPFLVPSNFFAVDILRKAAEILNETGGDVVLAKECVALADEVSAALADHAIVETKQWGKVYAFEIDGYGGHILMDDANAPSLLSLPYLCGVDRHDPVYVNTRRMILSPEGNPYCFRGKALEGIGSPHTGLGKVWPMSLIMRILTSEDDAEIRATMKMLVDTTAGTGFMHESVDADNPNDFTRSWFAWANTLFGEVVLELVERGKAELLCGKSSSCAGLPSAAYYRARPPSPGWTADRWGKSARLNLGAADKIAAGEVTVVGIPWAFPSNRIDWLFNPTKKKGPFNPEWTWQLNRMAEWGILARTYDETGDEKYARAFAKQFADWLGQTGGIPSETGYNDVGSPWRTIEEGLRLSRSWNAAFEIFRRSPSFTDDLLLSFVKSSEAQARHLLSHSTGHNWLLMEMTGVYVFAVTFPEIPDSVEMRKEALKRFTSAARAQLLPDGIHDELSPDYHNVLYATMAEVYRLARAAGLDGELPDDFRDILRRGAEGTLAMTTPGFVQPRFNDCYTIHASSVMRHAADFFPDRKDFQWAASGGREGEPPCGETASRYLPFAGFAIMRGDWSRDSSYLAFDVGPLGTNHQHQDKLSFTFWKGSEELLFDDGGGEYDDSALRIYARSGYDHNTLLVDGLAQNRREPQRTDDPIDAGWTTTLAGDFAFGVYDQGFGPKMANLAVHRREIRFDRIADVFTVTDEVRSADGAEHEYALLFHIDTTNVVVAAGGNALLADYGAGRKWRLAMSFRGAEQVTTAVGRTHPSLAGWFVGRNDMRVHPATTVFVTSPRVRDHKFVTKFKAANVRERR